MRSNERCRDNYSHRIECPQAWSVWHQSRLLFIVRGVIEIKSLSNTTIFSHSSMNIDSSPKLTSNASRHRLNQTCPHSVCLIIKRDAADATDLSISVHLPRLVFRVIALDTILHYCTVHRHSSKLACGLLTRSLIYACTTDDYLDLDGLSRTRHSRCLFMQ